MRRPGVSIAMSCRSLFRMVLIALLATATRAGATDDHILEGPGALPNATDAAPGFWSESRAAAPALDAEQREIAEQLQAIGYLSGSTDARGRGIVEYDVSRAAPGFNLYTSGHEPGAILMDMDGRELHRWTFEFAKAFPESPWREHENTEWWRRAYLYPNGDILGIVEGFALLKLDKHSNLIWASDVGAHHDLDVRPNGDIFVLTREAHMIPRVNAAAPVLEDFVAVLGPDGKLKRRVSLLEAFEKSEYAPLYRSQNRTRGDLFHTNSLEVLDDRLEARMPAFEAGRILVSMNNLSVIALLDLESERIEWAIKGGNSGQHDPKILENGHLLLFDNRSIPGASQVIEFDLVLGRPVWSYRGSQAEPFFSKHLGTAQRLPNGNTLITESNAGRAFEVTRDKTIVWDFYNPQRAGEGDRYIATIFELLRLPPDFPLDWIPSAEDD